MAAKELGLYNNNYIILEDGLSRVYEVISSRGKCVLAIPDKRQRKDEENNEYNKDKQN